MNALANVSSSVAVGLTQLPTKAEIVALPVIAPPAPHGRSAPRRSTSGARVAEKKRSSKLKPNANRMQKSESVNTTATATSSTTMETGTTEDGDDGSSVSSFSSYESDSESSFSGSYSPRSKKVISTTAAAVTSDIFSAVATSMKTGLIRSQIKEDLVTHGKHILLTKGATIPHIQLTVDPKCAAEINENARKLPPLARAKTCHTHGPSDNVETNRLLRGGLTSAVVRDVELRAAANDVLPGFAKKTVCSLLHETEGHNRMRLSNDEPVPVGN